MRRITEFSVSLGVFALWLLFFGIKLPYHLVFQETYHMFLFTTDYLLESIRIPGGASDYIAGFLTQFFIFPWAGAFIYAALLYSVQRMVRRISANRSVGSYPFSFLPSILLAAFYTNEQALLSTAVTIITSLVVLHIIMGLQNKTNRLIGTCLMIPVMFMACGTLSLLFALPVVIKDRRYLLWGIPLILIVPALTWMITSFPLMNILKGLNYCMADDFPYLAWLSGASAVFLISVPARNSGQDIIPSRKTALTVMSYVTVISAGFLLISGSIKTNNSIQRENTFKYVFLMTGQRWNDILNEYEKDGRPSTVLALSSHNLALGMKGRLPEEMFHYPQNDTQGLIPAFKLDYFLPLALSQIYYQLGMVNEARRCAFEALQSIPHFQKSAVCYLTLAKTSLINGNIKVAAKYLDVLSHTLFYRRTSRELLTAIQEESCPSELLLSRSRRMDNMFLFSGDEKIKVMLSDLCEKSNQNELALHYLMGFLMLEGDLDSFIEEFNKYFTDADEIPEGYQEALLVYWTKTHRDTDGIPWNVSKEKRTGCMEFMEDVMAGKPKGTLKKKFGETYWFYMLYNTK